MGILPSTPEELLAYLDQVSQETRDRLLQDLTSTLTAKDITVAKVTKQRGGPKPVRTTTKKKANKTPPSPRKERKKGFEGKSPLALVVYGPPGVGKTEFAANFPRPGFLYDPQEEGIQDLVEFQRAPEPVFMDEVDSFEVMMDALESIALGKRNIQTLVLDALTGIERLIFTYHCDEHFEGDWSSKGFLSFMQGPKNAAKTDVPRLLQALDDVRTAGVNVVLLAHSEVKTYNNPEGADYDRYNPVCDKATWQQIHRWAKAIFFYCYHVDLDKSQGPKAKAKDSDQRFIYTDWSPAFDAKNRFGLSPLIDAGASGEEAFQNFRQDFLAAAKGRR